MLLQQLKNILMDRLSVRATNKLKRRLKHSEITLFFNRHNNELCKIVTRAEEDMDKIINKFFEDLLEKEKKK